MQKWGKTAARTQRWQCIYCHETHGLGHDTQKRGRLLDRFVTWLLGKQSQAELKIPARTWRYKIKWCWEIIPRAELVSVTPAIIILDGIKVGRLVCLIARTPDFVIAWRWVGWESSVNWSQLLELIPAPVIVVCDGQKGVLLAIGWCWPETRIQRCLFHLWLNIRAKLTLHPKTIAGQELLQLMRGLQLVQTLLQSERWQEQLQIWYQKYGQLIRERTYYSNLQSTHRGWGYTHRNLRSAYRQFEKLIQVGQLFTHLDIPSQTQPVPTTTNHIEGGINSPIRTQLKLHRGLSQLHQQRLVDWYLYRRTKDPKPTRNYL